MYIYIYIHVYVYIYIYTYIYIYIYIYTVIADLLLINYGEGGATKWVNRGSETFCALPPQDRVKLFAPPLLKSGNFARAPPPPYNMAKTSSYCLKTTPKLFVSHPSAWLKLFPPPLFVGVKLHMPPSRFVAPPLPVISDQSLSNGYY